MKRMFSNYRVWPLLMAITTSAVVLYTGCKKNDSAGPSFGKNLLDDAKSFYENDVILNESKRSTDTLALKEGAMGKPGLMKKIGRLLKWNEAQEYTLNGTHFLVTPLDENIRPFANKEYEAARCLIFYKDGASNMQMHIMEMVGQKSKPINGSVQEVAVAAFKNFNSGKNIMLGAVESNILFYDAQYKYEKGFRVTNQLQGAPLRLQHTIQVSKRPVLSTTGQRTTEADGCTIHYLVGYHYDLATGEWIDYEILTTWAECPQGENPPSFGGAGGSSGGSTPTDQCFNDCTANMLSLSSEAAVASDLVSFDVSDGIGSFGRLTKWQKPRWVCLKNLTWVLISEEEGQIELANPRSNQWSWKYLEHKSITFSGASYGGSVTPDNGSGTPSFVAGTRNVLVAGMELHFNVTYAPICDCPLIKLVAQSYSVPYTAHAIFPAKPN